MKEVGRRITKLLDDLRKTKRNWDIKEDTGNGENSSLSDQHKE